MCQCYKYLYINVNNQNLLQRVILETVENHLNEETTITTVADDAIARFMLMLQKAPSLVHNVDKLKVERAGSFYSIVFIDNRNNRLELARTPIEAVAKKLLPQITDAILKIVKEMRKMK